MPRWEPLHPDFAEALRLLAPLGLPYAEEWRRLAPTAVRLDLPRPSYWRVRRIGIENRRRLRERRVRVEQIERVIGDLLGGLVPLGRG